MEKKVAARAPSRKVDRETERRFEIAEELGLSGGGAASWDVQAEAAHSQKKQRERERVRVRREPPSGYRYAGDVLLEKNEATVADLEKRLSEREIGQLDRWMAARLRDLIDSVCLGPSMGPRLTLGQAVPLATTRRKSAAVSALDALRRAYVNAFGSEPEDEWKIRLREYLNVALRSRQGRARVLMIGVDASGHPVPATGSSIVSMLRAECPPETVPSRLTAKDLEGILSTATLGRGGGNKRAKRRKNLDTALDDLFDLLAQT